MDVANLAAASVYKVALFLAYWVVDAFGCRTDYHNEAIGWLFHVFPEVLGQFLCQLPSKFITYLLSASYKFYGHEVGRDGNP
jgi:hypothetical protein